MYRTCEFKRYGPTNELDILRYLNARLKQNSRPRAPNLEPNQLREQLNFLFLTDELKHQAQLGRSAINVIRDYTKAIPIYL